MQGGPLKLIYYAGQKLAVVPAAGGPAKVLTPTLDRNVLSPRWSADGSSILFLLEDDRVTHLASVPAQGGAVQLLTKGRRLVSDYSAAGGRVTVLASTPGAPAEVFALDNGELRRALPAERRLASRRSSWRRWRRSPSGAGTAPAINGFLVDRSGFRRGSLFPPFSGFTAARYTSSPMSSPSTGSCSPPRGLPWSACQPAGQLGPGREVLHRHLG